MPPVEAQREPALSDARVNLPQGTLDLLILRALALQPMHGWSISERIHEVSHATLQIPQGSLYPALHRLERRAGSAE
jgi:DNA-binding PadR family transcriptional regulator